MEEFGVPRNWANQYEIDEGGTPIPLGRQYGGGGDMSPAYLELMRNLAAMGIQQPWLAEAQVGGIGAVLARPEERETFTD
jgi:hypothetical protein